MTKYNIKLWIIISHPLYIVECKKFFSACTVYSIHSIGRAIIVSFILLTLFLQISFEHFKPMEFFGRVYRKRKHLHKSRKRASIIKNPGIQSEERQAGTVVAPCIIGSRGAEEACGRQLASRNQGNQKQN